MEGKKREYIAVELDDDLRQVIAERMDYLKKKRPDQKVTKSDVLRHALFSTGYTKSRKNKNDMDE